MISHQTSSKVKDQYLVGLTGNICSGKSKAADYFKELGAYVLDLDKVVHGLYKKNIFLKYKMYKEFGWEVFNKKLEVDRKKLGKIVFSDKTKMGKLESITWPYVERKRKKMLKNKKGIILIEAAMLYESGMDKKLDKNILVFADEEQQVKRLMERNKLSEEEALKRIRSQMPQVCKIKQSDYVMFNNGSMESLKEKVEKSWDYLRASFFEGKDLFTGE